MISSGASDALKNWENVSFTWALKDMQIVISVEAVDAAGSTYEIAHGQHRSRRLERTVGGLGDTRRPMLHSEVDGHAELAAGPRRPVQVEELRDHVRPGQDDRLPAVDGGASQVALALEDLGEDQLGEVVAFCWVGQGTYEAAEWDEATEEAQSLATGGSDAAIDELLDMPMLASVLEAGLAAFELSCDGVGAVS